MYEIIRSVLKSDFLILLGQHENLSTVVDPLTVSLVILQDLSRVEMSQARSTPVKCVLSGDVSHEGGEGFDPRIMLFPVEQINLLLKVLLADVDWLPGATLIVEEGEDVDPHLQKFFDCGDICYLDRVMETLQPICLKVLLIWMGTLRIPSLGFECRQHCVPETSVVPIVDVDDTSLLL